MASKRVVRQLETELENAIAGYEKASRRGDAAEIDEAIGQLERAQRRLDVDLVRPAPRRGYRRRNPSTSGVVAGAQATGAVVGAVAPLLPYAALAIGAWYVWQKFKAGFGSGLPEVAAGAAHAASAVPEAYGQAARTALDPSSWPATYNAAEQAWQAGGGQGSPIAGPYYGPAGPWGGRDDSAPVPPDQGGQ